MIDTLFQFLVNLTGASLDQIKLIFCLLISYPLGSVYVRLPRSQPALKHIFSIVVSTIYLLPILNLGGGALQLLCSVLATYFLVAKVQGPNMPWVVFAVVVGHLTINHIYRAVYEIPLETFEITGPQMVLTMKLTVFAWNVWDGRRPTEDLDKWQLSHRIVTMPSLLEFLGFAFYFPGVLIGPYTEYTTYMSLVDGSLHESTKDQGKVGIRKHPLPNGRKRAAYTRMVSGFVYLGIFVVFGGKYCYESVLADAWLQKSFLNRLLTVQVIGLVTRTKYYAVWSLTEGASILTGLGFTGFTSSGASCWDGAANVKVSFIEWPSNFKAVLDSWNIKTNIWLRETVYKRVARKGKKPGLKSHMVTAITSAFWHGCAGGYYLTFLYGGFVTAAGRLCRANFRPLFLTPMIENKSQQETNRAETSSLSPSIPKLLYDFTGSLASLLVLNFSAAPFVIAVFHESLEAWRRMEWYGLWMIGGVLAFFFLGGKRWTTNLARYRVGKAAKGRDKPNGTSPSISNGGETLTSRPYVVPPVDLVSEVTRS